jgi:hypothetical protein
MESKFWTVARIRRIDPQERWAVLESFTLAEIREAFGNYFGMRSKKWIIETMLRRIRNDEAMDRAVDRAARQGWV